MTKEVKRWITVNGNHIPIYENESDYDAMRRFIAERNEATKRSQIEKNKEQADLLNNKKTIKSMTLRELQKHYKDNYNITIHSSYFSDGCDPRFLTESAENLDRLYTEFPQLKELNAKIASSDFTQNDRVIKQFKNAIALSDAKNADIWLNQSTFRQYATTKQKYSDRVADGMYPKNTTVANTLIHELGHKLEYMIAKQIGVPDKDLNQHSTAFVIVNKAYEKMRGRYKDMQSARNSISKYAGKNYTILEHNDLPAYEETFAEAISDYISNGSKAKPFSKQIVFLAKGLLSKGQ